MGKIADTTRSWVLGQEQRRQMLAFDAELDEAEGKVRRLEAKVLDLEAKVNPLEREVERLNQRVEEETAKAARAQKLAAYKAGAEPTTKEEHLDENEVKILTFLARVGMTREKYATMQAIATNIGLNVIRTEVLLRGLRERNYVFHILQMGIGGKYTLDDLGQEYVVKHNIV